MTRESGFLRARADLFYRMDALFVGLGALGTRVWAAFSRRWLTAPVGVTALGLATAAGARAVPTLPPGLLVGAGAGDDDGADLSRRLRAWAATGPAMRVVRVVADPTEAGVADRLTGVLAQLAAGVPAGTRVDLYLDLPAPGEAPPAVALARWRAQVDQGWLSRAAGATRLARWLLHAPVCGADRLPRPDGKSGADTVLYGGWDVVERHSDLAAVRTHLSHALLLRLLAHLRFDHWQAGAGYVNAAALASEAGVAGAAAPAWALSPACFEGREPWPGEPVAPEDTGPPRDETARRWRRPPRLDEAQARWQQLAAHYLTLVGQCEAARRPAELRRLFGWGLDDHFDARGVDAACAWPAERVRQRVQAWCTTVEAALWDDWRQGRCALHDATARLAAQRQALTGWRDRWQQDAQRDEALAQRLAALVDDEIAASGGRRRWLAVGQDAALVTLGHRLQAGAMARTGAAIARGLVAQAEAALAALQGLHAMTEAADLALAALAGEADAQARAALPDPVARAEDADRLDSAEQLGALCRTWVLAGAAQREAVAALRADLFLRLEAAGGFRALAEHLGEPAGCAALHAACERRLDPVVVSSVAQTAVQALARRWQAEPAQRLVQLQALRARLGGPGAGGAAEDTLVLAAPLLPPAPPSGDEAVDAAMDTVTDRAQQAVDALREALQADAPDRPPVRVQRAAAPGPQSGGLLWLRRRGPRPLAELITALSAEPPPAPVADGEAERLALRRLLLLGEGFGAVHEDIDAQGRLQLQRSLLDDAGLELDRVPLAADWAGAVEALAADAAAAQALHRTLAPLLQDGRVTARLRETLQHRVDRLREAASPDRAEAVGQAWAEAARTALSLLRQDSARTDTP